MKKFIYQTKQIVLFSLLMIFLPTTTFAQKEPNDNGERFLERLEQEREKRDSEKCKPEKGRSAANTRDSKHSPSENTGSQDGKDRPGDAKEPKTTTSTTDEKHFSFQFGSVSIEKTKVTDVDTGKVTDNFKLCAMKDMGLGFTIGPLKVKAEAGSGICNNTTTNVTPDKPESKNTVRSRTSNCVSEGGAPQKNDLPEGMQE